MLWSECYLCLRILIFILSSLTSYGYTKTEQYPKNMVFKICEIDGVDRLVHRI